MHQHHHNHSDVTNIDAHGEELNQGQKAMIIAFILNLSFAVIEFGGGLYTNSMAIVSDAIHDLGDSMAIAFALYMAKISNKGKDEVYSYGYRRFTILGAIVNSIILITGSALILFTSIPRLLSPEAVISEGMLALSVLGVIFNYAAFKLVHRGQNLNDKTISLHLLEDLAGWVAVLIGSIFIYFYGWYIIDPILSILIALFIGYNVIGNLRSALSITMQSTPKDIDIDEISKDLEKLNHIEQAHHIHVWSLDGQFNIMTLHIRLKKAKQFDDLEGIKTKIRKKLSEHKVDHVTIEFEFI